MRIPHLLVALCLLLICAPIRAAGSSDDYTEMLRYLTSSRVDGHAGQGSSGAVAVNIAAGDLNAQANLRAIAIGDHARASVNAGALRVDNRATTPDVATATLGGQAFGQVQGLLSINQASGTGNAELNAVTMTLAQQGIRETSDAQLLADAPVSNGGHAPDSATATPPRLRAVGVGSTALQGSRGVVQLNQIAGSGNATANVFSMGVTGQP